MVYDDEGSLSLRICTEKGFGMAIIMNVLRG